MKKIIVDGVDFSVGDTVKIKSGIDARRIGKIYKFYKDGDIVTVAVEFSEKDYGMYHLDIIEKV